MSSVEDFITQKFNILPALIERLLLHPGLTVLGGPPKIGKSLLILWLCQCLIKGIDFLGFKITRPWKVYLIQEELHPQIMQYRIKKMGGWESITPQQLFISNQGFDLTDPKNLDSLAENITKAKADVLIFDPLISYHKGDENLSRDMSELFGALNRLKSELGISIIVVHHFRKHGANSYNGPENLRGSTVIHAAGDAYLCMEPTTANQIKLTFDLRHFENPNEIHIKLNPQTLRFEVCQKEAKGNANVAEIAKIIESEPGLKTKEVIRRFVEATGMSESTAYAALRKVKASSPVS